jgi:hypothetical protein
MNERSPRTARPMGFRCFGHLSIGVGGHCPLTDFVEREVVVGCWQALSSAAESKNELYYVQ